VDTVLMKKLDDPGEGVVKLTGVVSFEFLKNALSLVIVELSEEAEVEKSIPCTVPDVATALGAGDRIVILFEAIQKATIGLGVYTAGAFGVLFNKPTEWVKRLALVC
jgi:hypothetical protein